MIVETLYGLIIVIIKLYMDNEKVHFQNTLNPRSCYVIAVSDMYFGQFANLANSFCLLRDKLNPFSIDLNIYVAKRPRDHQTKARVF